MLLLSATVSFSQGNKRDSVIEITIGDEMIFDECCIRETHLEKDTATLHLDIKDYKKQITNLNQRLSDALVIQTDQHEQTTLTQKQLGLAQSALTKQTNLKIIYRSITFVLIPIALLEGYLLLHK